MGPTMPITPSKKRGLKRLTILGLLLAAAVFYRFKRKLIGGGIDTPIVITGGSLTLFSDTPFTCYKKDNDKQISHPKEGNKVVHLTVIDYSPLPPLTEDEYNRLLEGHYDFPGVIRLYDKKVERKCDVEASYTGGGGEDSVRIFTNSNGKRLKIKFKRKGFDEYDIVDDQTRQHRDVGNKLIKITIENDGIVDDVTCPSGKCGIRFTYKD